MEGPIAQPGQSYRLITGWSLVRIQVGPYHDKFKISDYNEEMAVNLQPLIHLHFLDQQIGGLNQRISTIPLQIQELERKIERFHRSVQEKENLISENHRTRKQLEGDIALIETKRNRYKEQLDTVKTNKEYTALQHEIEGVNLAIRQIEDQILAKMEEAELLKLHLEEAQRAMNKEEKVILEEKKAKEADASKLEAELQELRKQREGWVVQVPPPTMAVYERTATHRKGIAMAEAKDEICQECQMRIRPQLFQEIKRNDTIITCESCSRIFYYVPPANHEKEELQPSNL
jgi:predicted  nucleic acid-binding Zn-ribbon protein